jgi:hypothetical protein
MFAESAALTTATGTKTVEAARMTAATLPSQVRARLEGWSPIMSNSSLR